MKKVYLDYAATTPVDPRVLRAMLPFWGDKFGNTMSVHSYGREVAKAVERSRETIANFLGVEGREIIFTSSATESNNMVIKGLAWAKVKTGGQIMISAVEHDCVRESARWLASQGWKVTELPVDSLGRVDINFLEKQINQQTVLVSVIHGNNEVGTIQDIEKIGRICKARGCLFHTDAAQSFGKIKIDAKKMNIDFLTASSHKIYGPKGAAVLYIKSGNRLEPLLHGGGHEEGRRSSTVNVAAIVGMAKAVEISERVMEEEGKRIKGLSQKLTEGILTGIKGTELNGDPVMRLQNNVNISFEAVEGESILMEMDARGVAVSTGSACSSNSLEPSHVLTAMGRSAKKAHGSIRFSLGRWTKKEEIDYTLTVLEAAVKKIRKISPFEVK